jgi:hypothetical protein
MTDRQDTWPRIGSILKGAAAVICAMVGFAAAVLVPYLHSTRAETRPRLTVAQVVAPSEVGTEARSEGSDRTGAVMNHHYREAHRLNASN